MGWVCVEQLTIVGRELDENRTLFVLDEDFILILIDNHSLHCSHKISVTLIKGARSKGGGKGNFLYRRKHTTKTVMNVAELTNLAIEMKSKSS